MRKASFSPKMTSKWYHRLERPISKCAGHVLRIQWYLDFLAHSVQTLFSFIGLQATIVAGAGVKRELKGQLHAQCDRLGVVIYWTEDLKKNNWIPDSLSHGYWKDVFFVNYLVGETLPSVLGTVCNMSSIRLMHFVTSVLPKSKVGCWRLVWE